MPDAPASSWGAWLRQRRKALGFTHEVPAESAICSVSALRKIESDVRRPSRRLAQRLAVRLRVRADELPRFVVFARGERRVERLNGLAPAALCAALAPRHATQASIAVLPFLNLSADAANALLADGVTEQLLNMLARVAGLRAASRTSVSSFKGRGDDMRALASALKVDSVLEGSVRGSGRRVRIALQLIHAPTDSHLWSKSYDREMEDGLALQDDVARTIVADLRAWLQGLAPDRGTVGQIDLARRGPGRAWVSRCAGVGHSRPLLTHDSNPVPEPA
jgi:TolB-like protein